MVSTHCATLPPRSSTNCCHSRTHYSHNTRWWSNSGCLPHSTRCSPTGLLCPPPCPARNPSPWGCSSPGYPCSHLSRSPQNCTSGCPRSCCSCSAGSTCGSCTAHPCTASPTWRRWSHRKWCSTPSSAPALTPPCPHRSSRSPWWGPYTRCTRYPSHLLSHLSAHPMHPIYAILSIPKSPLGIIHTALSITHCILLLCATLSSIMIRSQPVLCLLYGAGMKGSLSWKAAFNRGSAGRNYGHKPLWLVLSEIGDKLDILNHMACLKIATCD